MPKMRPDEAAHGQMSLVAHAGALAARRTVITLGDLVSAAYRVTGTAEGTARLLGDSSPLGHLIDRRIVIG
jgi:hypothetical protein